MKTFQEAKAQVLEAIRDPKVRMRLIDALVENQYQAYEGMSTSELAEMLVDEFADGQAKMIGIRNETDEGLVEATFETLGVDEAAWENADDRTMVIDWLRDQGVTAIDEGEPKREFEVVAEVRLRVKATSQEQAEEVAQNTSLDNWGGFEIQEVTE